MFRSALSFSPIFSEKIMAKFTSFYPIFSGQNKTFVATWRDIAGSHLHAFSNDWSTYTNPKISPSEKGPFYLIKVNHMVFPSPPSS